MCQHGNAIISKTGTDPVFMKLTVVETKVRLPCCHFKSVHQVPQEEKYR